VGDFSGRRNRDVVRPFERGPMMVDRDNLDEVFKKVGAALRLPAGSDNTGELMLSFAEMDDFHPDRLYKRVPLFQALRDLRDRLSDPSSFARAAQEMRAWAPASPPARSTPNAPESKPERAPVADARPEMLLEQILGGTASEPAPVSGFPATRDWQAFMQKLVQPYLVPQIDYSQQARLLTLIDEVISDQMRAIMHHPDFQSLEAGWRGIEFLVRRLELDQRLKLYVLDVSKAELTADLSSAENLPATSAYRVLVDQAAGTPGGLPWAAVIADYTFDGSPEDVEVLGRMAKIAERARAPLLSCVSSRILGCASLVDTPDPRDWKPASPPNDAWAALRNLPEARYLGVALPRFLLRLPYGRATTSTESFDFEEMPSVSNHEWYLWGNPAYACAYLLAQAFSHIGWDLYSRVETDVVGLPVYVYEADGESCMKPCAETLLADRSAEAIREMGIMPLLSVRGRDAVRLEQLRSLADPPTALAGRWT
jgi:type VI secretion system protein ImpC